MGLTKVFKRGKKTKTGSKRSAPKGQSKQAYYSYVKVKLPFLPSVDPDTSAEQQQLKFKIEEAIMLAITPFVHTSGDMEVHIYSALETTKEQIL